ncbi:MAG: homoserine O-succinyltransferase [Elusimicrobium sp.]|jgi:homoserine O-succinyltransferase|nr:homoserine O-succinyltransferase [Elusimicrobium sp.]
MKIAILNLMPTKKETERQLQTLLEAAGAAPQITWLTTATYKSKNTDEEYLKAKYTTFDKIKNLRFDLFIITGAPVEHMAFEDVAYWKELTGILDFSKKNSLFNIYICWAAQAALYHFYGVNKKPLPQKCFGIFEQRIKNKSGVFYKNFQPRFNMPHSRHTTLCGVKHGDLIVEAAFGSEISVISARGQRALFITGHPEYDADTLHNEYMRDLREGKSINMPQNYYPQNNPQNPPPNVWRAEAVLFYTNIINHIRSIKNETV